MVCEKKLNRNLKRRHDMKASWSLNLNEIINLKKKEKTKKNLNFVF